MAEATPKFFCAACQRGYVWKKEIAGKRTKCRCGQVLTIPAQPSKPPPPPQDDLYDFAEPTPEPRQAPVKAPPLAAATAATAAPLGYQSSPTARDKSRALTKTLIDPKRDFHAPIALLILGFLLYNSYYVFHYDLSVRVVPIISLGLAFVAVLETGILVGFALLVAGPLGVSFGGLWTAILKLAAIAIFSDGVTTWVDGFIAKWSGGFGGGFLGFGALGFPVALGIYWSTLIYLFDMDPGDSWMVVVILSVFYRILRVILMILLLNLILGLGGVRSTAAAALASSAGATPPPASFVMSEYKKARTEQRLTDAKKWAADNKLNLETQFISDWYSAGAKSVSFALVPVGIGSTGVDEIFIELPDDPTVRAKCLDLAKAYYDKKQIPYDVKTLKDEGDPYLLVGFDYQPVAPPPEVDDGNQQ